ncbi:MAG: hypothetical protein GVY16_00645, partial [Planctomycetes bacterium]|nr:hypothetical protein [Planctomycetota bacterium]
MTGGTGLTLAGWTKADDFGVSDGRIISKAQGGIGEEDHYWMLSTISDGGQIKLRFRLKTNGDTKTLIASSGALEAGEWAHVAATWDGASMRLYKNGELVGQTAKSGSMDLNVTAPIGIGNQPLGEGDKPFDGRIDEVRVYNRPLSDIELLCLMNVAEAPVAADDVYAGEMDAAITVDATAGVLGNDTDGNGDALTASLVSGPANGTLAFSADGSFNYTPNAEFVGTDVF